MHSMHNKLPYRLRKLCLNFFENILDTLNGLIFPKLYLILFGLNNIKIKFARKSNSNWKINEIGENS